MVALLFQPKLNALTWTAFNRFTSCLTFDINQLDYGFSTCMLGEGKEITEYMHTFCYYSLNMACSIIMMFKSITHFFMNTPFIVKYLSSGAAILTFQTCSLQACTHLYLGADCRRQFTGTERTFNDSC